MAFMSVIAERRAANDYDDAEDFIARNGDLREKGLLSRWYSPTRMGGALARQVALMPDRAAN